MVKAPGGLDEAQESAQREPAALPGEGMMGGIGMLMVVPV